MNRRNVMGNRIEESKTLWVIITGILVTMIQFAIYHFVNTGVPGILLSAAVVLIGSIVVHFITAEQEELMGYLLIPCMFSGIMGLLLLHAEIPFFPESKVALLGCLLTWLVPVVYATVYTWATGNVEIDGFAKLFLRAVTFFYLVYFALVIYGAFFQQTAAEAGEGTQWIPFATFAALVNGVMKQTVSVGRLIEFLLNRVVFFLPYGFFIGLVCRKLHGILRVFLLLFLPALLEMIQLLFHWDTCDVDDVIFRFIGSLFGFISFLIYDAAFQHFTARHFNGAEVNRDYYGRKI